MSSNVNWAPNLLPKSCTFHEAYTNTYQGVESDTQDMSQSPQYIMEFTNPTQFNQPVYVMLSRHYTQYFQLLGNENYRVLLSVQLFEIDKPRLVVKNADVIRRIEPEIIFTNTPYDFAKVYVPPGRHIYCAIVLTVKEGPENNQRFNFTIQFRYPNTLQGQIKHVNDYPQYHFTWRVGGAWDQANNGGRRSLQKYDRNPTYLFSLPNPISVIFYLESVRNKTISIHLCLFRKSDWEAGRFDQIIEDSGDYRNYSCSFRAELPPGEYALVASSYPFNHSRESFTADSAIRNMEPTQSARELRFRSLRLSETRFTLRCLS